MNVMEFLRSSTPEECQELGEILCCFAQQKRDDRYFKRLDAIDAYLADPDGTDLPKLLKEIRDFESRCGVS